MYLNANKNVALVSASAGSSDPRFLKAVSLHLDSIKGNAAAALEANKLLEQLRKSYPGDPLVTAYYGSSLVLIARDKSKALEKLRFSNEGMKLLDEAVAANPQHPVIRLLRGKNAYQLPERYFQRTRTMIEDYTFLLELHLRGGALPSTVTYSELVQELGAGFSRIGKNQEASELWTRLESLSSDPAQSGLLTQKKSELANQTTVDPIANDNPFAILIETSRTVGSVLVEWSGEGKKGKTNKKTEKLNRKNEKPNGKNNNKKNNKKNNKNQQKGKKQQSSNESSSILIRR